MYKLLLVTDREEVRKAFLNVTDLADMMFAPITIISDVEEAISYLERNAVDAVGYSIHSADVGPLHQYLVTLRPSLPIYQTHHHDETLRAELLRIRRFLDALHADYSDESYDEAAVLEYLRDELMDQLLALEVPTREELKSRLKLVRAHLSFDRPCFLFDFDLPQGEVYLSDRWHYGRERLENSLRSNFFGRYIDNIFYGVAVLTPRHIRLLAVQRQDGPEMDPIEVGYTVQRHVQAKVADIKEYLDLDLNLEQYTVLNSIMELAGGNPQA
ncbi:MAG: hypothetical protein AB9880_09405 [Christensenellales bacterium]